MDYTRTCRRSVTLVCDPSDHRRLCAGHMEAYRGSPGTHMGRRPLEHRGYTSALFWGPESTKVIASPGCQVAKEPCCGPVVGADSNRCLILLTPCPQWKRQEASSYHTALLLRNFNVVYILKDKYLKEFHCLSHCTYTEGCIQS